MGRYKQDNSSYGIGLTARINNFKRVFLFFLLFCFLIMIIFSESLTYFKKKNLAENIVNGITTILVQGDNRQVLEILNNTFRDEFSYIHVENLITTKNFVAFGNKDESLLSINIIIPVYFDKEMTKKAAVVSFSYRLLPYSSLWIFLLIFIVFSAIFIFNYFKKKIIMEYYSELKIQESETQKAIYLQVSHDIRSPLAALNMIITSTDPQSESDRVIMRSAVQRINDIANQLLNKGKASVVEQGIQESKCEVELLSTLIDSIVSEKRIQFREKQNFVIESKLNDGYGLFSNVNATELLRTISNTLNNAIEALPNSTGKIFVSLSEVDSFNVIKISDNGKGIPKHILEKLGQMGVSHGKVGTDSGSGLGVYHAKKTIESFGGRFEIESVENQGTIILIKLPKADSPSWFVKNIQVPQIVVVLE